MQVNNEHIQIVGCQSPAEKVNLRNITDGAVEQSYIMLFTILV